MMELSSEFSTWASWTLVGVMTLAGLSKLTDKDGFITAVINYKVLPDGAARLYARLVPWLEISSAACLVSGNLARLGALLSVLLTISFTAAAAINLARGRQLDCGCMGKLTTDRAGWPLLFRNMILIGLAAPILMAPHPGSSITAEEWLPVGILVVAAVIFLTFFSSGFSYLQQALFSETGFRL